MKLFKQLLVAPAALGLLAPLAATAAEPINVEELSAGAFSSATKMSGGSVFTSGWIDTQDTSANIDNHLTVEYNFTLDLNTSFTGEDNLYAGFETGNQNDLVLDSSVISTDTNDIELHSLYYTFPVGEFQVSAGPLFDQDDIISATTSIYSSAFRLAEMPWGAEGDTGAGAAISYVNDNGWNASWNIIAENADTATTGAFTEEGLDKWTVSLGYDAENYGGGIVYTDEDSVDTSFGAGVYFRPDAPYTISLAMDRLTDSDATDSSNYLLGIDYEWGPGTASAAYQTVNTAGTTTNNWEVYYNYPVNDSVAVQGGVFVEQVAGDANDDTQGLIVETFFSF